MKLPNRQNFATAAAAAGFRAGDMCAGCDGIGLAVAFPRNLFKACV